MCLALFEAAVRDFPRLKTLTIMFDIRYVISDTADFRKRRFTVAEHLPYNGHEWRRFGWSKYPKNPGCRWDTPFLQAWKKMEDLTKEKMPRRTLPELRFILNTLRLLGTEPEAARPWQP